MSNFGSPVSSKAGTNALRRATASLGQSRDTYTTTIQEFLSGISPFEQLSSVAREKLSKQCQLLRYRMGQPILVREKMPAQVAIIFEGQARLLGYDPRSQTPVTLKLLQPGAIIGWVGLVRGVPCETVTASTETVCLTFNASDFLSLLDEEPSLATAFRSHCALVEIFELLGAELGRRAEAEHDLKSLALEAWSNAVVCNLAPGRKMSSQLDMDRVWFVSGGSPANSPVGSCLNADNITSLKVNGPGVTRLVGIPESLLKESAATADFVDVEESSISLTPTIEEIPYAPAQVSEASESYANKEQTAQKYPFVRGKSPVDGTLACFQMPSLSSLRSAHSELLKRHRETGSTPELLAEMEEFIYRGRATGALLDTDEDRWASQSLLDYWSAILYRAGREPPDATLAEFESALAPELDDARCPYLGLEAFREKKSNLFYGRQRLLEKLVNHLKQNRLLAVIGSSGSGKSSVVLGGLLPKLKVGALSGSENWHYYSSMVPGVNPLENLARLTQPRDVNATEWLQQQVESLQKDPNHLTKLSNDFGDRPSVLVVDQFEEVFSLCRDDSLRQAFIDNLIGLIQSPSVRHTVILTMRTDFESQVARVPVFKDLFEQAQVRMTALDASELREAIEKPAELVGLKFEEGLVEALLQDVLGEPAALPLLQFTLLKLWDNRERNRVTWETYKRLGGGRQALARSADEFYEQLIPEEQVTVKRILLRMVRPTEGLEVTSNRIQRKTLYQTGEARDRVDRVLDKLIQARLVRLTESGTPDDAQVEVAHEALVRNWPRLVSWLEDERVSMRQRLRLKVAVEQWEAYRRDPSALLRGTLLNDALTYKDLNELETEFIQCSIRAEQKEREAEEERRQRELEQEQRLRAEAESAREQEQLLKRQVTQLEAVNSELRESQQHLLHELHELRTPLNSVLGWARLLRTRSFDEATTARALEIIERNAQAQVQMIEDILDVSRIIGGKLKLNLRSISIIPIIEAAINAIRPAAEEKAISIESVLDHELEPIPGDPERLQQVVWNLLTNALKFTPKGGRVTVQLERIDSYAQFQVSDTGQGIRAEVLPHIFDRFPQGKGSLTRSDGGLPLVIIRHLVELHEGTIQAESLGEGQGATFIVKLPLTATRIKATDSSSSVKVQ